MKRLHTLLLVTVLVVVDQLLKLRVLATIAHTAGIPVIPNLFSLTYVENRGAAFGIFQGRAVLLAVFTGALLAAIFGALLLGKVRGRWLNIGATLIVAGGIGNFIDRVRLGFVVDYLDFSALFGFPVFNFADCCVVVGTALLFWYILFVEPKERHLQEKEGQPDA